MSTQRVQARFIGGRADGYTMSLPADGDTVFITMNPGPQTPPADPDEPGALDMLRTARGEWELYSPIANLAPDHRGRIGYGIRRQLTPVPGSPAAHITPAWLALVEALLEHQRPQTSWAELAQSLDDIGYHLVEPVTSP